MSLIERLKNPVAIQQWLRSADGQQIVEYFRDLTASSMRQCVRKSSTIDDIRYAQGSYDAASQLVKLDEDIKQYLDDVRTGKIKPQSGGEVKK